MKTSTSRPVAQRGSSGGSSLASVSAASPPAPTPATLLVRIERLQGELARELERRQQLERAVAHGAAALVAARRDLAHASAGQEQALHAALHDVLTSLPNRRCFRDRLDQELARTTGTEGSSLAVMYLDLDAFKPINDVHGHEAGDQVLKIIAARLAHAVRAEDLMSRLGGDEFACLLANRAQRRQLRKFAGKLLALVAAPITVAGRSLRVHPSIGIALAPADGSSTDALIRSADAAMLHAKRTRSGAAFADECPRARPATGRRRRRSATGPAHSTTSGDRGQVARPPGSSRSNSRLTTA